MSSSRSGSHEAGPHEAGPREAGPREAGPREAGPLCWITSMDSSRRFHWEKLFVTHGELSVGGRRRGLATWWSSHLHWQ